MGKPQIFVKIFDDDVILSLELDHEANFICSMDGLVISLGAYFAFATFRQLNSISQSYKLGHLRPQGTIWASETPCRPDVKMVLDLNEKNFEKFSSLTKTKIEKSNNSYKKERKYFYLTFFEPSI